MELNTFRSEPAVAPTYAEVGASEFLPLPDGYHHLLYRRRLGDVSLDRAADAVETFELHRRAGVGIDAETPRAEVGTAVTVRLGVPPVRVTAPCRVVAVFADPDRRGFAYGTLPGHPERGEEAFLLTREDDGVWFEVRAFSRPARWYTRLGGPLVPAGQRLYAWHLTRVLRRLLRAT